MAFTSRSFAARVARGVLVIELFTSVLELVIVALKRMSVKAIVVEGTLATNTLLEEVLVLELVVETLSGIDAVAAMTNVDTLGLSVEEEIGIEITSTMTDLDALILSADDGTDVVSTMTEVEAAIIDTVSDMGISVTSAGLVDAIETVSTTMDVEAIGVSASTTVSTADPVEWGDSPVAIEDVTEIISTTLRVDPCDTVTVELVASTA